MDMQNATYDNATATSSWLWITEPIGEGQSSFGEVMAANLTSLLPMLAVFVLRAFMRYRYSKPFVTSDLLLCISVVLALALSIGTSIQFSPHTSTETAAKIAYVFRPIAAITLGLPKAALYLILLRLCRHGRNLCAIWTLLFLFFITGMMTIMWMIVTLAECQPTAMLWTPGLSGRCLEGGLVHITPMAGDTVLVAVLTSFVGAAGLIDEPTGAPRRVVIAMMGMGTIVMLLSIMRLIAATWIQWDSPGSNLLVWTLPEVNCTIITVCLPGLIKLFASRPPRVRTDNAIPLQSMAAPDQDDDEDNEDTRSANVHTPARVERQSDDHIGRQEASPTSRSAIDEWHAELEESYARTRSTRA